jgi:hypothetical protein
VLASGRRMGLRIPEDVAVVGVDHTPVGQLWSPPLTTIDVKRRAITDAAIRDLHLATNRDASAPRQRGELARLVRGGTSGRRAVAALPRDPPRRSRTAASPVSGWRQSAVDSPRPARVLEEPWGPFEELRRDPEGTEFCLQ